MSEHSPDGRSQFANVRNSSWKKTQAKPQYTISDERMLDNHLVHIEMQSRRHSKLARRLWRYNALLDLKYKLRVRSIAVLLRPAADSRKITGMLDLRLPDKDRVVAFYYRVIRAWEQPVEPLLTGSLATLPMAALADVPVDAVPEFWNVSIRGSRKRRPRRMLLE